MMKIVPLINDTYQVVENGTVWFQGSLSDCDAYMRLHQPQEEEE